MDDGVDLVLRNQRRHARLIPAVADHERRARRHRPIEARRQIVEHHHPLAGVDEGMNHVATDIAGAAGDEDRHMLGPLRSSAIAGPSLMHIR